MVSPLTVAFSILMSLSLSCVHDVESGLMFSLTKIALPYWWCGRLMASFIPLTLGRGLSQPRCVSWRQSKSQSRFLHRVARISSLASDRPSAFHDSTVRAGLDKDPSSG